MLVDHTTINVYVYMWLIADITVNFFFIILTYMYIERIHSVQCILLNCCMYCHGCACPFPNGSYIFGYSLWNLHVIIWRIAGNNITFIYSKISDYFLYSQSSDFVNFNDNKNIFPIIVSFKIVLKEVFLAIGNFKIMIQEEPLFQNVLLFVL